MNGPAYIWTNAVRSADHIRGAARAVLFFLASVARDDGASWYSQTEIADGSGFSDRTVRSVLSALTSAGVVEVTSASGHGLTIRLIGEALTDPKPGRGFPVGWKQLPEGSEATSGECGSYFRGVRKQLPTKRSGRDQEEIREEINAQANPAEPSDDGDAGDPASPSGGSSALNGSDHEEDERRMHAAADGGRGVLHTGCQEAPALPQGDAASDGLPPESVGLDAAGRCGVLPQPADGGGVDGPDPREEHTGSADQAVASPAADPGQAPASEPGAVEVGPEQPGLFGESAPQEPAPTGRRRAQKPTTPATPATPAAESGAAAEIVRLYTSIVPDATIKAADRHGMTSVLAALGEAKALARFRWLADCQDPEAVRKRAWIRKDSIPLSALCRIQGKGGWLDGIDKAAERWAAPPSAAETAWADMMARQWMARPVDLSMKHAEATDRRAIQLHEEAGEHERRRRAWRDLWGRWVSGDEGSRRLVKAAWLANYGGAA